MSRMAGVEFPLAPPLPVRHPHRYLRCKTQRGGGVGPPRFIRRGSPDPPPTPTVPSQLRRSPAPPSLGAIRHPPSPHWTGALFPFWARDAYCVASVGDDGSLISTRVECWLHFRMLAKKFLRDSRQRKPAPFWPLRKERSRKWGGGGVQF